MNKITVAEYLTAQIALCGKTQSEIAHEAGFEKPNIITMFKQGKSKVPLARIPALAQALGVDPRRLFSIAVQEYEPETWGVVEQILGQLALTPNEIEIITAIRQFRADDPKIRTRVQKAALKAAIEMLAPGDAG